VLENGEGEIATVLTPLGLYLPGGGIEAGETPEEAIVREAREEAGLLIRPAGEIARVTQFSYSPTEGCYFEKPIVFLRGEIEGQTTPSEPDHELLWQPLATAARGMAPESHGWVLGLLRRSERWKK